MTLHYTAAPEDAGKTLFSILRDRLRVSAGPVSYTHLDVYKRQL